jgi:nucleotide-binding universal stress UspA family protein
MFKNILVPLDGSQLAECVLPHVVAMARAGDAEVTLLRVLDPASAERQPNLVDPLEWQINKAEAESYLRELANGLQARTGIGAATVVLEGKAAESVLGFAKEQRSDLIILSSHGQSGISGWNVSSVVQKIILRVRTSILIIRAYHIEDEPVDAHRYQRMLVPLDGSPRAEFVLPAVAALARAHQSEVLAAHVIRKPELPRRIVQTQEDQELVNRLTERNREDASAYLAELAHRLDAPILTRLVISENVVSALHTQVEQEQADLVVLSAHGYGGDTRWPYGSVVFSFIAYGTTPLLVLQDLPPEQIEVTPAERAAREQGGR